MITLYDFCPICGSLGKSREIRINGNDRCENGHIYPSKEAISFIQAAIVKKNYKEELPEKIEVFFNSIGIVWDGERYWLSKTDGEAMEVSVLELEKLLSDYYEGKF